MSELKAYLIRPELTNINSWGCVTDVVVMARTKEKAIEMARNECGCEGEKAYDNAYVQELSELEEEQVVLVNYHEL